jgi:hypothetical protein
MKIEESDLSQVKRSDPKSTWIKEELYLNEECIHQHDWKSFCVTMAK